MAEQVKLSVCALIIYNKALLIVKRSAADSFLPNVWEFPGGSVENNETLQQALIREIKEEINLDISTSAINLIGISEELSLNQETKRDIQFNYEVILTAAPQISISSEHSAYDWIYQCDERLDDYLQNILAQSRSCRLWLDRDNRKTLSLDGRGL